MAWLVKDKTGIACAILAWLFMAFAQYALLTIVLLPQPDSMKKYANLVVFELFSFLALMAHLKTMFTDPGSVPQRTVSPEMLSDPRLNSPSPSSDHQMMRKCSECLSVKPDRAHHCSVCKRCIKKMDHHCPWVNNCIGERNQKYFVLFTLYVAIISTHALILTVGHLLACLDNGHGGDNWNRPGTHEMTTCAIMNRGRPSASKLIMSIFLVFESLLFQMFTFIMFYLQMKAIWTDWTGIENLKKESRCRRSGCKSLRTVCGSHFLLWLSPFTRPPPKESVIIDC